MSEFDQMAANQALRKALLDEQEAHRKANELAGRAMARTQALLNERHQLREAISQAHGALHRGDAHAAKQLLEDAMKE